MPHIIRGSDVFLKEDIRSILQAILAANDAAALMLPDAESAQAYRCGFTAAVVSTATAFDIQLQPLRLDVYGR
jgi:hypothetical protein